MKCVILLSLIIQSVIQAQLFNNKFDIREYDLKKYTHLDNTQNINYPGDQTIDVIYYKLDLTFTTNPNWIKGMVIVKARVDTTAINTFFLDLKHNMIVDSILLEDSIHIAFSHNNDSINIYLNRFYNFNEIITINIFYQGLPETEYEDLGLNFDLHSGKPVIWSLSEPYYANFWWPCKDTPKDKVDSADVILTVDTALIPVSNGLLKQIVDNVDGTHTYKWNISYPIAQYLISVAISNYNVYINYYVYSENDSMAITNYIFPEDYTTTNLNELKILPEMLDVYASLFGEYPFIREKFGNVQSLIYGGMEHQTITTLDLIYESLLAHETAHQWFGDKITCQDWHHIWLNEGFAEFVAFLWREFKYGKELYNTSINASMNGAKNTDQSVWVDDISDMQNIFSVSVYYKGCVVLHMLRGVLGDSLFFKTLLDYAIDPELIYNTATTEDFQRVAETVSGMDLNYFFSEWIYGKKYPKYKVYWNKTEIDSNWNFWLKLDQVVNISPSFFTMPIEVKVNFANSDTTFRIFNDQQIQEFNILLSEEPISIVIDPNNLILKDIQSIVLGVDKNSQLTNFSLFQNYPNPFNPSTKISWQSPVSRLQTLKVYDVLGNEVATLINEYRNAGSYEVDFDASKLSSGVYFYQLKAGDFLQTKKMILIK